MRRLIEYLRNNVVLDFQGEMTLETLREMLSDDPSSQAQVLLAKVAKEGDVDNMMLALADRFLESFQKCVPDDAIREHLNAYAGASSSPTAMAQNARSEIQGRKE